MMADIEIRPAGPADRATLLGFLAAFQDYERLHMAFGHRVPVIWDRRRARNRPLAHADTAPSASIPNRRRGKLPVSWTVLGFVVVDRPAKWARAALSADSWAVSYSAEVGLPA